MAYAENFHGGVWFSGIWWSFVFGERCLWPHNLTSYSWFPSNVLAKFVDITCVFFYIHSPSCMCDCTEYKLSALEARLSEENKFDATTQQFITAKPTGCTLQQGSKTHSSMRQSNLERQIEAALMPCRKWAVGRRWARLHWLAHTLAWKIESC